MRKILIIALVLGMVGVCGAEGLTSPDILLDCDTIGTEMFNSEWGETSVIDFTHFIDKNQIIVTYRGKSSWVYPEGGGPPDEIWKAIYSVQDGKIVKIKEIRGQHIPGRWENEQIIFPDK